MVGTRQSTGAGVEADLVRSDASPEDRQRWMRDRHAPTPLPPCVSLFAERHYSVKEVAALWSISPDAARRIFQNEPGVLALGDQSSPHRRRYTTLRIPESILERVHRRMCKR